jgi:curved DNA-binding protein CbpA
MVDPHTILEVSPDIDEAGLRQRYLELVRQNPPEKHPRRFAEIREAYEQLRDPAKRLEMQLFQIHGSESLDDVIADLRSRVQGTRIPTEMLLSLATTQPGTI